VRAELCGYGESSDADHIARPSAVGQTAAMRAALASARIEAGQIAYVNAHGTGTKANDATECESLRAVFGADVDRVAVASTKSYVGTRWRGGGDRDGGDGPGPGGWPPAAQLEPGAPRPRLRGPAVGGVAEPLAGEYAMKNSFGFGGSNAVLVLRRAE